MGKKTKRAKPRRSGAAKAVQLKLRSVIDELERDQCQRASHQLIEAANLVGQSSGRKGKRVMKTLAHFTEVEKFFTRTCVRGSGGGGMRPSVPFEHPPAHLPMNPHAVRPAVYPVAPSYDMSYQAGPRHPLPGRRALPPHEPQAHGPALAPNRPPPSVRHTHPFIDGLGGLGGRSPNYVRVNSMPDDWGTRGGGRQPFSHPIARPHACPKCDAKLAPGYSCTRCANKGHYALAVPRKRRTPRRR